MLAGLSVIGNVDSLASMRESTLALQSLRLSLTIICTTMG